MILQNKCNAPLPELFPTILLLLLHGSLFRELRIDSGCHLGKDFFCNKFIDKIVSIHVQASFILYIYLYSLSLYVSLFSLLSHSQSDEIF